MDWLTQTFAQYSIAWLFISAVVGLLAGAVSSWITYELKKRELIKTAELKTKEIAETVAAEIEKERQSQAILQQKEKENRIREEIVTWANPILGAVNDLEHRLENILCDYGYLALDKNKCDEINPNWSITYEYFTQSTLYLFAQYYAWIQMLREKLNFELFQSEQTKDEFFIAIDAVSSALGSFPHPALKDCSGKDRQVFRLQQRAIGELLILRDSNPPRCMSYPDFQRKLEARETLERHLEPLRALLENVSSKDDDNCRWKRLVEMRKALGKLKEQCQEVLKPPEEVKQV